MVITNHTKTTLIAIIVAVMAIIIAVLISIAFQFNLVANLVMSWIITTAYAIFAFFLIEPVINVNPIRFIEKTVPQDVIRIIEKPVIREIQVPIENKVIEVVEKEVIREVPVDRIVYRTVERKQKKLNIPRYNYIGSTQTLTYHKRNCKFSKMLKKKYKLQSNSKYFFKKKHYKACKTCLKKK